SPIERHWRGGKPWLRRSTHEGGRPIVVSWLHKPSRTTGARDVDLITAHRCDLPIRPTRCSSESVRSPSAPAAVCVGDMPRGAPHLQRGQFACATGTSEGIETFATPLGVTVRSWKVSAVPMGT